MIRDYFYKDLHFSEAQFKEILSYFGLKDISNFKIIKSQDLTPDSFAWKIVVNNDEYVLYAEDYISSVQYTEQRIVEFIDGQNGFFVPWVRLRDSTDKLSLIDAQNIQNPPDNEWINALSVTSGYDSVFLYKLIKPNVDMDYELLCLAILRAFKAYPPYDLKVIKIVYPSPHNRVFICMADELKYYILNDDTTGDNKNYILSQLKEVNHLLRGELLRNPGNEPDGAIYPVGIEGSEYFLFKVTA